MVPIRWSISELCFQVKSSEQFEPQRKPEPVTLTAPSLSSPAPVSTQPDFNHTNPEVDIKTLRDSIQKVHDLKPSIDNICLHRYALIFCIELLVRVVK